MEQNIDQFSSQMNFLATYQDAREKRMKAIEAKKNQLEDLKPAVEEYESLKAEVENLQKENRQDEKFLINMNEMVIRNTGNPISSGPLFDEEKKEEEEVEQN